MPKITFHPKNLTTEVEYGTTILNAVNRNVLPLGQSCSGFGICGWCRVKVLKGIEHISKPNTREEKLIQDLKYQSNERAGCLTHIYGDVEITTTYW